MSLTWRYIKRIIKNINNEDYKKWVLYGQEDPYDVKFESLGNSLRDKNVLIIKNGSSNHGFFAEFRTTLNCLSFAERFHFAPYVYYNKDFCYAEEIAVNGTKNPFEYYFEQPAGLKYDEVMSAKNVVYAPEFHGDVAEELNKNCFSYEISEEYINHMAEIMEKYIRFNVETEKYLKKNISEILGNYKVLGIHYRGTDFKQNYNHHPVAVTLEKQIAKVKVIMESGEYDKIFLATDDVSAIELYSKTFGERVVFYKDVCRSEDNQSVAFSKSERKQHHYLLGLEVLRDMYTLANCKGLVSGMSQVSNMARIMKRALHKQYTHEEVINLGINSNKKNFTVR